MNSRISPSFLKYIFLLTFAVLLISCRGDEYELIPSKGTTVTKPYFGKIKGFFLLNEANMGSNLTSIDFFDYESGTYFENIYPTLNPSVKEELGNVGNDIKIYGDKLFAVINISGYVEVMDVKTGMHIDEIPVENCRYIAFHNNYAYITSYNSPVDIDRSSLGMVVKVDLATMSKVDSCQVGYQPEQMVIRDNKLYVANSGGYEAPKYDNRVSVIDLNTFKKIKQLEVGINLHHMLLDSDNNIYVSSRGDYKLEKSKLYVIDENDNVAKEINVACSDMTICGDSIYVYGSEWSSLTNKNSVSYSIINTKLQKVVADNFITDGTESQISQPYGIAINPETREIFVTDAKLYFGSGWLYCFSPNGKKKWGIVTGEIPAHIAFTEYPLQTMPLL